VRVVLAESFERIHRSNLVGMGVLPLQFLSGESVKSLGLHGDEVFDFYGISDKMRPRDRITGTAVSPENKKKEFYVQTRIDTHVELEYYKNGGILPAVLRKLSKP
jgi:aconitate hydratase